MARTFKKVLITGGAGFIGSNYVHYVAEKHPGWEIVVLDKLTYAGNKENLEPVADRVKLIVGDIANRADAEKAMDGCDAVVNFAAESHVDRSLIDSSPFVKTNVEGTVVLLDTARKLGVNRFLHISTDEVYGDLVGSESRSIESDNFAPRSPYAATKAAAEHMVFSYATSFGMDIVVTRGSNNYGPYQYPEKIIPLFITNAFDSLELPIYNDGSAVRDYMYVTDHCSGIDLVLHEGETATAYNLGAGQETSGLEVADMILEICERDDNLKKFVTDRPGHDYRYAMDVSRAETLGWQRTVTFKQGLEKTIQWYRDNEPWWRRVREKLEYQKHEKKWYNDRETEK